MKLTDCKFILAQLGIRPSKSLGQNFLVDPNILHIIVRAANLRATDIVLEIGPGLGALTERLVPIADKVIAIEKDARLFEWLQKKYDSVTNLQLVCGDALTLELPPILRDEEFKIVANLSYSISSPFIERFVESPPRPILMTLTLQREMAQRLAAKPGTKDFGALTLFTQLYYHVTFEHIVSRRCFYPAPDVDSAIVTLDRRDPKVKLRPDAPFKVLVRAAFSQRRKMLRKLLAQSGFAVERVDIACEKLKIQPKARGEELSLQQFIQLANELSDANH